MIESPYLERFVNKRVSERVAEAQQRAVLTVLESRFGAVADETATALRAVTDESRLLELTRAATRCPDLESFRAALRE